jgi:predicted RNase H-like HicB family nuclease
MTIGNKTTRKTLVKTPMKTVKARVLKLPVIVKTGESGYFIAEVPIIPGCFSQGKTKKEALANIKEAAELCLECQKDEGWTIPEEYYLEQVEVSVK